MMANFSKTEKSIMKVRIGNIEPYESVKIKFHMIGNLTS